MTGKESTVAIGLAAFEAAQRLLRPEHDASASANVDRLEALTQIATADVQCLQVAELRGDFERLLANTETAHDVRIAIVKCTADITKIDAQRVQFSEPKIMRLLVDALQFPITSEGVESTTPSASAPTSCMELIIQVCRALGNIFYMNNDARTILDDIDGITTVIRLLDVRADASPWRWSTKDYNAAEFGKFVVVRCGMLSNYLMGHEQYTARALQLGIGPKLKRLAMDAIGDERRTEYDNALIQNVLPPLTVLVEGEPSVVFDDEFIRRLVRLVRVSGDDDIVGMVLDLLQHQAENPRLRLSLAQLGLCDAIYDRLQSYDMKTTSSADRMVVKLCGEILVQILTGDEAMHHLYDTPLHRNIETWLDADDMDLLQFGVLALGNFARTDSHCIRMVETGVMHKMLAILARNNSTDDNEPLQHALLSTLRNLVIPKPNKAAIIEAGLVPTILPMLAMHYPPVVFRLLGTLRMAVDGQEKVALELLQNGKLIAQLVEWGQTSSYASVMGESLRTLAWLVKNAYVRSRNADLVAPAEAADGASKDASAKVVVDDSSL